MKLEDFFNLIGKYSKINTTSFKKDGALVTICSGYLNEKFYCMEAIENTVVDFIIDNKAMTEENLLKFVELKVFW